MAEAEDMMDVSPSQHLNASVMSTVSGGDFEAAFSTVTTKLGELQKRVIALDDLGATEKRINQLEEKIQHQVEIQEQKDAAQDELLNMEFDAMKRDLNTLVRGQDLEEQKQFLLSKMSHFDLDLKESMRSLGASLREEVSKDSQRLKDQLEKVSSAVTQQVKMVAERLKENAEADNIFEKLVRDRLALVEAELGIGEQGKSAEGAEKAGGGKLRGAAADFAEKVEGRMDSMAEQFAQLQKMMLEQQEFIAEIREGGGVPGSRGGKTGTRGGLEKRVATLEDRVDEVAEKGAAAGREIENLKQAVSREPNPLDWLEEKVGELARRKGGEREQMTQRLGEAAARLDSLEKWQQEVLAKEEAAAFITEPPETEAIAAAEGAGELQDDEDDGDAYSCGSAAASRSGLMSSSRRRGPGNIEGSGELSYVNLFEDMERLRCIVEAMEDTMPMEVRRAISFFKGPRRNMPEAKPGSSTKKKAGRGGSDDAGQQFKVPAGFELEAEVVQLRGESDDNSQRVQRMEELLSRECSNLLKAVRGVEREQDQQKLRVDDLWHKFPRLLAILDPLQVKLQPGTAAESDLQVQAESAIEALKPLSGLLESALQKSIDRLRQDLLQDLSEVRGGLETKASSDDFLLLRDRVERWARAPMGSPQKPTLASYKGKALERQPNMEMALSQTRSPDQFHQTVASPIHAKCKQTTAPHSASTGRLPSLSRTR